MTSKTCHSPSAEISACWSLRETLHNQCYNPQNQFRRPLHTIHEINLSSNCPRGPNWPDTLSLWRQMQKVPVASIQSARPRSLASTPAVENPPLQLPEGKQGVTPLQNYIGSSGLHWQTIQRTSKNQHFRALLWSLWTHDIVTTCHYCSRSAVTALPKHQRTWALEMHSQALASCSEPLRRWPPAQGSENRNLRDSRS